MQASAGKHAVGEVGQRTDARGLALGQHIDARRLERGQHTDAHGSELRQHTDARGLGRGQHPRRAETPLAAQVLGRVHCWGAGPEGILGQYHLYVGTICVLEPSVSSFVKPLDYGLLGGVAGI